MQVYAFAQNPYFKIFNKSSGLISNTVYDLSQNQDGFLFFATDKGLVRFDGINFYNYKTPTKNSKAVSNLIVVEGGQVFCQNFIGEIFKTKDDELIRDEMLSPTGNYYAMRKWDNCIVTYNTDTLKLYDYKKKKIKYFPISNVYPINSYSKNNKIYAIDLDFNIICFHDTCWNFYYKRNDKRLRDVFFMEHIDNSILFLKKTNNEKVHLLKDNKLFELTGIKDKVFVNNVINKDGVIWVCTTGGLYKYDLNFKPLNNGLAYFNNYNISNIIKDKEGAFWISTIDKGVIYVPDFNVIEYGKNQYQFSSATSFQNVIFLGSYNNQVLRFNINIQNFDEIFNAGHANEINAVLYDSLNDCIIAGSSSLFFIKNKALLYSQTMGVKDIKLTNNKVLLTAFSAGATYFKPTLSQLKYSYPNYLENDMVNNLADIIPSYNYRTRSIEYYNTDSLIFIANSKGLYRVDKSVSKEIKYNDSSIIASNLYVHRDALYIGTFSNGILKYHIHSGKTSKMNITVNNCIKLKIYNNQLFFINENGFYRYDEAGNMLSFWNTSDGINSDAELKDFVILKDTAYIASNMGLITFPISKTSINKTVPFVVVNSISGNYFLRDSIYCFDNSANELSVNFSVLSYRGIDSVKIFYKINNDDWISLNHKERRLQLSYLAPGNYEIKIKAINEDGVEFVYPKTILINVSPPFYQTWWFFSLLAMCSLGIGLWINKYRLRKLMQKQKEESDKQLLKQQIDLSNLKTLRAQMNPHFIFNALNSIQSYVYSGDKEMAGKYLSLFSDLSRSLLDNSAQTEVSLYDELKLIDLYLQLETIRLPKIKYKIIKDDNLNTHEIHIPAMIIQPIVENAIKHGLANKSGEGMVEVKIYKELNNLIFEIEDNGVGREKSQELNKRKINKHQSFATQAIENRILLLNKNSKFKITQQIIDKYNDQRESIGTLVKVTIPLNFEYELHNN